MFLREIPSNYIAVSENDNSIIVTCCNDYTVRKYKLNIESIKENKKQKDNDNNNIAQCIWTCGTPGTYGRGSNQFYSPIGIVIDFNDITMNNGGCGMVYVCDYGNHRIQVMDGSNGNILKTIGRQNPFVIDLDLNGNLVICEHSNNRIQIISRDGTYISQFGKDGTGNSELKNPTGVTVDKITGNIIVSDNGNHRIQIFNSNGEFIKVFGGTASGNNNNQFHYPFGLCLNETSGELFVADADNWRIQIFE